MSDTSSLTLLGNQKVSYPTEFDASLLESFANQWPGTSPVVEIVCPEFTSLCPKTGQPDFATITITYRPDQKLVESKSLKLYLFSFRNKGEFHEDCINRIANDLNDLMAPVWIEVRGDFFPRGGISINPTVRIENYA